MKKCFVIIAVCCLFLLSSCTVSNENAENNPVRQPSATEQNQQIRALWLSCYELSPMFEKGTSEYFSDEINRVFEKCNDNDINTLFVQVRPFCDAFYPSQIFEWSQYTKSSSGQFPDFDPLAVIIDTAENYGVSVHAWINPYRVSYDEKEDIPSDIRDFAFSCEVGVFLNPSSVEAQKFVLDGVREILENYEVDGIHIDDYFYPQTEYDFDETDYRYYRDNGGTLSKSKWRRENVNSLTAALYSLVHSLKPDAVFSISPSGDISKNKNSHYADVELWLTQKGYADWIIPQIYYGFENEKMPFEKIADKWIRLAEKSEVRLICGLASYKQGEVDKAAGKGEKEWVNRDDIISRQIDYIQAVGYGGYALFSYSSL